MPPSIFMTRELWKPAKNYPLAQTLAKLRSARKTRGDIRRTDIVNPELCDQILHQLAPSLQPYRGCPIIDINPGVGLWSSKIHDLLKPRKHYLLEWEEHLYFPFLKKVLDKPGSTYCHVPTSKSTARTWHVVETLLQFDSDLSLPNENHIASKESSIGKETTIDPKNLILILANLRWTATPGSRGWKSTENMEQELIFRYGNNIRYQKQNLRMLAWMSENTQAAVLPRTIFNRGKTPPLLDLVCDYSQLVGTKSLREFQREPSLEKHSAQIINKKMEDNNIVIPETRRFQLPDDDESRFKYHSHRNKPEKPGWLDTLTELEEAFRNGEFQEGPGNYRGSKSKVDPRWIRLRTLRNLQKCNTKRYAEVDNMLEQEAEALKLLQEIRDLDLDEQSRAARIKEFSTIRENISNWLKKEPKSQTERFWVRSDERRAFFQKPPVLMWDRRPAEPLVANNEEFFPKIPLSLVDFRPRPNAAESLPTAVDEVYLSHVLDVLYARPKDSALKIMSRLINEETARNILKEFIGLKDDSQCDYPALEDLTIRSLNDKTLKKIIDAYLMSPFKPDREYLWSTKSKEDLATHVLQQDNPTILSLFLRGDVYTGQFWDDLRRKYLETSNNRNGKPE
ncbi:MAG: hypothetical protein M1834_008772 [Cirrosporium novae-zelandiae]|nr:MAG: hypothetical protein M1834_008772 [Cirrosporium novae-zelandiae]